MFSIVFPMDLDRLEQFTVTKRIYDKMPQIKEILIPTRSRFKLHKYLVGNNLMKDVRLIPYSVDRGFNCSKALNLAVRRSSYDRIVITSPEVKPITDVLAQFEKLPGVNILAKVDDEAEDGKLSPLVNKSFRGESPAMYFLAVFNKKNIEQINGWDEEFMRGYAYEDNDFGERWMRAGLPFEIREEIQAIHQYHPRAETVPGGTNTNFTRFNENNNNQVIRCAKGLYAI